MAVINLECLISRLSQEIFELFQMLLYIFGHKGSFRIDTDLIGCYGHGEKSNMTTNWSVGVAATWHQRTPLPKQKTLSWSGWHRLAVLLLHHVEMAANELFTAPQPKQWGCSVLNFVIICSLSTQFQAVIRPLACLVSGRAVKNIENDPVFYNQAKVCSVNLIQQRRRSLQQKRRRWCQCLVPRTKDETAYDSGSSVTRFQKEPQSLPPTSGSSKYPPLCLLSGYGMESCLHQYETRGFWMDRCWRAISANTDGPTSRYIKTPVCHLLYL